MSFAWPEVIASLTTSLATFFVAMATGRRSQFDFEWQLLCPREGRGSSAASSQEGTLSPSTSSSSSSSSCDDVFDLLTSRSYQSLPDLSQVILIHSTTASTTATTTTTTSPAYVPIASLISITDDSSVSTDSCATFTPSEASVTRAPTPPQVARHPGHVLNGCDTSGEAGAVGGATGPREGVGKVGKGKIRDPSVTDKNVGWGSGGGRQQHASGDTEGTPTVRTTSPSPNTLPLKAPSPAGTPGKVPLTSSSSGPAASSLAVKSRAPPMANESRSGQPGSPSKSGRDKIKQEEASGGDLAPNSMASRAQTYITGACSPACAELFTRLHREVTHTKHQLSALSVKMEEQASHISKLMEENRRYIRENGKLKKNRPRESQTLLHSDGYETLQEHLYGQGDNALGLEGRIYSLQLQNSELNLNLAREKRKRREAEARLQRDENYIKRLEDSVQVLRETRVVMDPSTYRQVAESYIADRRTPARRPHTHTGLPGSDLVCDSQADMTPKQQRFSHPPSLNTYSCPTSSTPSYYPTLEPQLCSEEIPIAKTRNGKTKKDRGHNSQDLGRGLGVGSGSTMNPWDYQQLLESLEDLDGASRGALS